jgi:hypothetical protein
MYGKTTRVLKDSAGVYLEFAAHGTVGQCVADCDVDVAGKPFCTHARVPTTDTEKYVNMLRVPWVCDLFVPQETSSLLCCSVQRFVLKQLL